MTKPAPSIVKKHTAIADLVTKQAPQSIPLGLQTILLFGEAGTGKTSVAAGFPDALYLDLEASATGHAINALPFKQWPEIKGFVEGAVDGSVDLGNYKTLVVDTVSDLWELCRKQVLADRKLTTEPENDYGKTLRAMRDEFTSMFNQLMILHKMRRMGTVLIAHEVTREVKLPFSDIQVAAAKVADKEIATLVSAKPQMVLRTFVTQTNPVNGEQWPEARFLTQARSQFEGSVVKDRTNRLPAFMPTSYDALSTYYNKNTTQETSK